MHQVGAFGVPAWGSYRKGCAPPGCLLQRAVCVARSLGLEMGKCMRCDNRRCHISFRSGRRSRRLCCLTVGRHAGVYVGRSAYDGMRRRPHLIRQIYRGCDQPGLHLEENPNQSRRHIFRRLACGWLWLASGLVLPLLSARSAI